MLAELGFGLDLSNCAASGETTDLVYVSPKSGGAVSRTAGEPWRDRLLRLPAFLREGEGGANGWSDEDLQDGFRLTGLFLLRHVLEPRGQGHSDAREGFINAVTKYRATGRLTAVSRSAPMQPKLGLLIRSANVPIPPKIQTASPWENEHSAGKPAEIHEVMLRDALEERYLAYALSTIMHRALPDARDGLKPVHRRILYGMRLLRLDPGSAFKKSAKIVGDVMGSFHPHGDQAIYDAMVRLAQDFSSRYPLVDGQGNFGNIDGDNPAAYRYTEARMTDVARLLLEGIDEDGVEFRPNYDGQTQRAGGAARRLPEPARQRRAGHRGRHGDLDPAAQRRRTLRRRAASDREARSASRRRC